jgi:hypothetical protein
VFAREKPLYGFTVFLNLPMIAWILEAAIRNAQSCVEMRIADRNQGRRSLFNRGVRTVHPPPRLAAHKTDRILTI